MWQRPKVRLCKRRHERKLVRFCVETSHFSYYFEMLPPLFKVIVFFSVTFLQYDVVVLISLLDGCYHHLVFMDPVNGSKSKLLVKSTFH